MENQDNENQPTAEDKAVSLQEQLKDIANNIDPSPELVEALTAKHGKLKKVVVSQKEGAGDEHTYYFRPAKLQELRIANKKLVETRDTISYAEIIIKSCAVNGRQVILDNEDDLIALVAISDELTASKVAQIEKN